MKKVLIKKKPRRPNSSGQGRTESFRQIGGQKGGETGDRAWLWKQTRGDGGGEEGKKKSIGKYSDERKTKRRTRGTLMQRQACLGGREKSLFK